MAIPYLAVAGFGAGMQMLGNLMRSRANKTALKYEAQVEETLAHVALQDGAYRQWMQRMQGSQESSAAVTSVAAGDIDTSKGSPAGVISNVNYFSELNAAAIGVSAARQAWMHKTKAAANRAAARSNWLADLLGVVQPAAQFGLGYSAIGNPPTGGIPTPANDSTGGPMIDVYNAPMKQVYP